MTTNPNGPDELPETLYHYCSLETAIAIVTSRKLRMGSLFHMNDSLEHRWLCNLAADALKTMQEQSSDEALKTARTRLLEDEFYDIYCACLSKDGDSLSQWRAYADDGYGIALGFDPLFFEFERQQWGDFFLSNTCKRLELCKVIYDPDEQQALVTRCLKAIFELNDGEEHVLKAESLFGNMWFHGARCKNPAFHAECEWRMIYRPPFPVAQTIINPEYRFGVAVRNRTLIPYFDLPVWRDGQKRSSINAFVLGPKVSKETEHTFRAFLTTQGLGDKPIRRALASYRTLP